MQLLQVNLMVTQLHRTSPHIPVFSLHITTTHIPITQHTTHITHAYMRDLQTTRGSSESSQLTIKAYFYILKVIQFAVDQSYFYAHLT